jgi:hypothetical protein
LRTLEAFWSDCYQFFSAVTDRREFRASELECRDVPNAPCLKSVKLLDGGRFIKGQLISHQTHHSLIKL